MSDPRTNGNGPRPLGELLDLGRILSQRQSRDPRTAQQRGLPGPKAVRPVSRCLSDIKPESVAWLFPGRIALGKLCILEGHPGQGKSTLLTDLAARVTTGRGLPGDPNMNPSGVLLLNAEEGAADTIRPRLEAAGANCDLVHLLDAVADEDGNEHPIVLGDPGDKRSIRALEVMIESRGIKLICVDVLMAFLSSARDSYRDQDIRIALRPLSELAERTGCAIVAVRHLRKSTGGGSITAGGGSIASAGAARSVLLVDRDPADPNRRVLAIVKNNLAPLAPSLSFQIEGAENGSGAVSWLGVSDQTADSLTQARALDSPRDEDRSKADECADFLVQLLADGPLKRKEVLRAAKAEGFPERTIDRAAKGLGVLRRREGFGAELRSLWELNAIPPNRTNSATRPQMADLAGMEETGGTEDQIIQDERRFERECIERENEDPPW